MVSIIVPVYNVAPFLDECIASIVSQSYTEWEAILVDDGSTDGSSNICDCWSKKDSRIKVIHQSNSGVSTARNNGIDAASGEYITFVDSDDYVDESYLQEMINATKKSPCDIVVSGVKYKYKNREEKIFAPSKKCSFTLSQENCVTFVELNKVHLFYAPYSKLYRSDIIKGNNIAFPKGISYGEDLLFIYNYLSHTKNIACTTQVNYNYRILGSGTLSSKHRDDQFAVNYSQWKILKSFYVNKEMWNDCSQELLYKRLWGNIYDGIFLYPLLNHKEKGYINNILSIPEIEELKKYSYTFDCAAWIKKAILMRCSLAFKLYFAIKK